MACKFKFIVKIEVLFKVTGTHDTAEVVLGMWRQLLIFCWPCTYCRGVRDNILISILMLFHLKIHHFFHSHPIPTDKQNSLHY